MPMFRKKIFLFVFSLLFFVLTEPAVAKMNRAPADPIPPIPSNYPIRQLAGDVDDVRRWLKEGLGLGDKVTSPSLRKEGYENGNRSSAGVRDVWMCNPPHEAEIPAR